MAICSRCLGSGRLADVESCPQCSGTGQTELRAVDIERQHSKAKKNKYKAIVEGIWEISLMLGMLIFFIQYQQSKTFVDAMRSAAAMFFLFGMVLTLGYLLINFAISIYQKLSGTDKG